MQDKIKKGDHNFYKETGSSKPPNPPDKIGKGDHNFYKETGFSKPPNPPDQIGEGIIISTRKERGHAKKVEFP